MLFADRRHAGRELAQKVSGRAHEIGPDPIVLALPRGGVPVGYEVARRLSAQLEPFVVRKLGVPRHEELAMGAIAPGGVVVLSRDLIDALQVPEEAVRRTIDAERRELERRDRAYRSGPPPRLTGRGVILVDDGLATGATMLAAIAAVRRRQPARITVAVPVAAPQAVNTVGLEVDDTVYVAAPERFSGVGLWYDDFSQTGDEEVQGLLAAARAAHAQAEAP